MTDFGFDELKKRTLLRKRLKTNLVEHKEAIKKLMDLDVSLPVILEWLVGEKKIATTLPALRRFVRKSFSEEFYDDFAARNGWQKKRILKENSSSVSPVAPAKSHEGQSRDNDVEVPIAVSSSFESMLDGKQRDDFTKKYLPLNPLFNKRKMI